MKTWDFARLRRPGGRRDCHATGEGADAASRKSCASTLKKKRNDQKFAKQLANLAEYYVNDAFGSAHRAHASTEGITKFMKQCAAGLADGKGAEYLGQALQHPEEPFVAILGGAKVSDKIGVIQNLMTKVTP